MVCIFGSKGSLNIYWKNKYIVGLPLSDKRDLNYYQNLSYQTIRQGFQHNENIESQCRAYSKYMKLILKQINNNEDIDFQDLVMAGVAVLALVKFNRIDLEDVSLICGKKKSKI